MKYNIKYINFRGGSDNKLWKKTLHWRKTVSDKGMEIWSGNENKYKDMFHIHGKNNILTFGHNGIEASTLICINAAYFFISQENIEIKINTETVDKLINNGIDLYQAFANTKSGERIINKTKTLHMEFDKVISFFNTINKDIEYFDTKLLEYTNAYTPDFHNYHEWLSKNIKFYTDKESNELDNHACIILNNSESFCLIFLEKKIYFFDPNGRGMHFFDIPKTENQYSFVHNESHDLIFSNNGGYIIKANNYDTIRDFLQNTIPNDIYNKSIYIKLK